jgi:hypothetical protein
MMKVRAAIMKDMDKNGYTPFFDPAKRFDVDPALHPAGGDTLVDTLGARPETNAKYTALAQQPEGLANLQAAYDQGMTNPEAAGNWYHMGQLQDEFTKVYGPELGPQMFRERFAKAMASTTGGADPTSNLLMAAMGNYERAAGRPTDLAAWQMPTPIGGRYASGNMQNFTDFAPGVELQAADNPKRFNFQNNFLGHKAATIDEQMSNLFEPGLNQPPQYSAYQQAVHDLAEKNGVDPRWFQEVAWAGGKHAKEAERGGSFAGKPMISIFNDAIERTRRLTGQTPEEVVHGFVTATQPLYTGGPAGAAAGALATQPPKPPTPYVYDPYGA